jgi:hypothetical protein
MTDYFGSAAEQAVSQGSSSTVTAEPTPPSEPREPIQDDFKLPASISNPSELGPVYEKLGWLPAPTPPDDLLRRRALYRFNILHTARDVNFDRIAHMAKLVFNTKIAAISLIDGETQWHKTESGLGVDEVARISSFCSHTVLLK